MAMRVQGPGGAVIEFPDGTDEATVGKAMMQLSGTQARPEPSWWEKNITGLEDSNYGRLPATTAVHPDLVARVGQAATLGSSDAQLADVMQKQLGDRFVRREKDANGYDVMITRGDNGQEVKSYVNRPGLELNDVARGLQGALPYALTGGVAGLAGRGAGLLANAALQGGAGAATSVGGDLAMQPLGSQQGVEGEKAAAVGLMSAGLPIVARGVGNVAGAVKEWMAPTGAELRGVSPRALQRVEEAIAADGNLTPQTYQAARQQLGPEAMLGDMGRTLQTDTARLGRIPVSSDRVVNAVEARQYGAANRIKGDLDANLGPERNLPQYIAQQTKAYSNQASPFYEQFYATPIEQTPALRQTLARMPRSVFAEAERLARADGIKQKFRLKPVDDPMTAMTGVRGARTERVHQGVEYDYLKRAVDDLARNAAPGSNEQRIFSNLARDLRTQVDEILSPGDPRQSAWAQSRSIAGEGLEGKDAVELSANLFSSARDPNIVQSELAGMSKFGKDMYREGARNNIRQVMGRASSNFSAKGDTGARRVLNKDFSRQNLEQIAGPQAASNINRRIDAENHMAGLYDMVKGNSITSTMEASKARWPTPTESRFASDAGKKGPLGLATEYTFKIADMVLGGQMKKAEAKAALDAAGILTAQGKKADAIVKAIFNHIDARKAGRMAAPVYERNVKRLIGSLRMPAAQYISD